MRIPIFAAHAALATAAALALAGMIAAAIPSSASARPRASSAAPAKRGLAFAQARCSGCHAVEARHISPNPEAPPFEAVVNAPGVTRATLEPWLRDSHNYPEKMNFTIDRRRIADLAAYLITLQRPDYAPPQ